LKGLLSSFKEPSSHPPTKTKERERRKKKRKAVERVGS